MGVMTIGYRDMTREEIFGAIRVLRSDTPTPTFCDLNPRNKNHRRLVFVLQRDGDRCFYCHEPMGSDMTLEHLRTLSTGGGHDRDNLRLAHRRCNMSVRLMTVEEKWEVHHGIRAIGAQ